MTTMPEGEPPDTTTITPNSKSDKGMMDQADYKALETPPLPQNQIANTPSEGGIRNHGFSSGPTDNRQSEQ